MAVVRNARNVGDVLAADAALAGLLARQRESQARWTLVASILAPELARAASPGPLDADAWTILAHLAAAAKLRHLRPLIEAELARSGWGDRPLRIKLRPKAGP
jgi:hypothetical protein